MRYIFGFMCVCALGVMPLVGCSETTGVMLCEGVTCEDDGNECTGDGVCDPADGECDYAPAVDGTECGDESNECAVGQCASGACELTPVTNGTACGDDAGSCQDGTCEVACTEQGIRDAIAVGGGPYKFDCNPPNGVYEVSTQDTIEINNDVKLDGGGMVVSGGNDHRVFSVGAGTTVELRGITVRNGAVRWPDSGGGIFNAGDLTLENCFLYENAAVDEVQNCPNFEGCPSYGGGIFSDVGGKLTLTNAVIQGNPQGEGVLSMGETVVTNSSIADNGKEGTRTASGISIGSAAGPNPIDGTLTVTNSTVSFNGFSGIQSFGAGVSITNSAFAGNEEWGIDSPEGPITVVNSTVSENRLGIRSASTLTATHTTVTGNNEVAILLFTADSAAILSATLVDGTCMQEDPEATWTSNGYNIESPGDTCDLDQPTDQDNVSADDLALGNREPYAGLGGLDTEAHALLPGSVAIDVIPEAECEVETDQRGEPRPETGGTMCDAGAFERQPEDP